jgi:hypothetical protein
MLPAPAQTPQCPVLTSARPRVARAKSQAREVNACRHTPRTCVPEMRPRSVCPRHAFHSPDLCLFLNGHGPALKEGRDQGVIYLQAAVIVDEALLFEPSHEFAYPCAGGTNHLRQG